MLLFFRAPAGHRRNLAASDYFAQAHRHRRDAFSAPALAYHRRRRSNATPLAGSTYAGVYPFSTAATDLTCDFAAYSPDNPFGPFTPPSTASSGSAGVYPFHCTDAALRRRQPARLHRGLLLPPHLLRVGRIDKGVFHSSHSSFSQRDRTPADVGSYARRPMRPRPADRDSVGHGVTVTA